MESSNNRMEHYGLPAAGKPRFMRNVLLRNTMINEWCYRDDDR